MNDEQKNNNFAIRIRVIAIDSESENYSLDDFKLLWRVLG